jgi:hypothetical protein
MKKLILLMSLLALPAFGQIRTNVTLTWDYFWPDVTNMEFRVYQTTNVSSPRPWQFHRTVPAGVTNADVAVMASQQYFYVTATNLLGESDPSNIALCPAPPRSDTTLRVK